MTTLYQTAQNFLMELKAGVLSHQSQNQGIAWGRQFIEMPDGDQLFLEIRDDGLDTIYIVGPLLEKALDVQFIVVNHFDRAAGLVANAFEASVIDVEF